MLPAGLAYWPVRVFKSSSTNGKTALKKAPHINDYVSGRVGNLTTYSIRLRSLERRVAVWISITPDYTNCQMGIW